ncbi:MAG: hypothetical protein LBR36_00175 [Bacteroidales bacterium]|jgi:hypothetical protein|nr:hypothetical protein [Bacteroidales bacterium]
MTAQIKERLFFNGKEYGMATEPLHDYLEQNKNIFIPDADCTACWRGYIGTWTIKEDNKLYLTKLHLFGEKDGVDFEGVHAFTVSRGLSRTVEQRKTLMDRLFPNQNEVFAEWFSGEIRVPYGKMLDYVHGGYLSLYEKDMILFFVKGVLIGQCEVDNNKTYQKILRERVEKQKKEDAERKTRKNEEKRENIMEQIAFFAITLPFLAGFCIGVYSLLKWDTFWKYIILTPFVVGVLLCIFLIIKNKLKK